MIRVTAEQVRNAILAVGWARPTFIKIRECGLCYNPIGYRINYQDGSLVFDGNCDCGCGGWPMRLAPWSALSDLVNMQTEEKWQHEILAQFNMTADGGIAVGTAPVDMPEPPVVRNIVADVCAPSKWLLAPTYVLGPNGGVAAVSIEATATPSGNLALTVLVNGHLVDLLSAPRLPW